jgi:hypothetical protein
VATSFMSRSWRKSRMVEISSSGSGEGPGWATARAYSKSSARTLRDGKSSRPLPPQVAPFANHHGRALGFRFYTFSTVANEGVQEAGGRA